MLLLILAIISTQGEASSPNRASVFRKAADTGQQEQHERHCQSRDGTSTLTTQSLRHVELARSGSPFLHLTVTGQGHTRTHTHSQCNTHPRMAHRGSGKVTMRTRISRSAWLVSATCTTRGTNCRTSEDDQVVSRSNRDQRLFTFRITFATCAITMPA